MYRIGAGSVDERARWVAALRDAIGRPMAREPPPREALEQLASLSGSVTAQGGSSLAVRIQKHLATENASDKDLARVLSKGVGLLPLLRALQAAHEHVHGRPAALELHRSACLLGAKAGVLLRQRGLIPASALEPAAAALDRALSLAVAKERRVRPSTARLLPGAVAVDASDPFHMELASAGRTVGAALRAVFGPHLSEGSALLLQETVAALSSQEVLTALFGSALKPSLGIACAATLGELLDAASARLQ